SRPEGERVTRELVGALQALEIDTFCKLQGACDESSDAHGATGRIQEHRASGVGQDMNAIGNTLTPPKLSCEKIARGSPGGTNRGTPGSSRRRGVALHSSVSAQLPVVVRASAAPRQHAFVRLGTAAYTRTRREERISSRTPRAWRGDAISSQLWSRC